MKKTNSTKYRTNGNRLSFDNFEKESYGSKLSKKLLNRAYNSQSPNIKIKGTLQQLVDKYKSLSLDETGRGKNSILKETYKQYAEHYQRRLNYLKKLLEAQEAEELAIQAKKSEENVPTDLTKSEEHKHSERQVTEKESAESNTENEKSIKTHILKTGENGSPDTVKTTQRKTTIRTRKTVKKTSTPTKNTESVKVESVSTE